MVAYNTKEEKEKTRALFEQYAENRDKRLRDILIERNLYIAEILAKKYINRGIDYDDLYQVASIGLILAVDRYDVSKGFEFSSFATPTIVGEIKRYFRDKGWVIRVPRRIQELSKKINSAKVYLAQNLQRSPTVEEIARYLKIDQEEVLETMEGSKVYAPQSLDQVMDAPGNDRDINLQDLIGREDDYFSQVEIRDFIEHTIADFNEIEKKILFDRYFEKKTQVSIARELGISQMTVSRIEKKIIDKFKTELKRSE